MSENSLSFKANVGIKDIIGRGLILDDNIAIVELIKNAKDAGSKGVKIHFSDKGNGTLTIVDTGTGMSLQNITDKWLNIAYSEKKERKDDRIYAGSKGVGRFSCDRLGEHLDLYTKSDDGEFLKLPIDWTLFEINEQKAEISSVELQYETLTEENFLKETGLKAFETGTVLKISKLRSSWEERKTDKLRSELEKFVSDPNSKFDVFLQINEDEEEHVKNTVFEELEFRTYYIKSRIGAQGKAISTKVFYNGETIYEYVSKNPYKSLKNVEVVIHFLNMPAKAFFTRKTGVRSGDYGSVFLFLNGFRVFPYGNPKNDWLGLDQRKSQGTARYLGTRELIGKISLKDKDDAFVPISSREGMVHNDAFQDLVAHDLKDQTNLKNGELEYGYVPHIIRQFEKVVVGGINWSSIIDLEDPDQRVISEKDIKIDPSRYSVSGVDPEVLKDLIEKTLNSKNFKIRSFEIYSEVIAKLSKEAEDAYNEYVLSFIDNTTGKEFKDLSSTHKGDFRKIAEDNMRVIKEKKEAVKRAEEERLNTLAEKRRADQAEIDLRESKEREAAALVERNDAKTEAAEAKKKVQESASDLEDARIANMFLQSDVSQDKENLFNLHHQIVLSCTNVQTALENFKDSISGRQNIPANEVLHNLGAFEKHLDEIAMAASFATNQKYKLATQAFKGNIVEFISKYLDDENMNTLALGGIKIRNNLDISYSYIRNFYPLDITILIQNLISNSRRSKAKEIVFSPPHSSDGIFMISDNSKKGLDSSIKEPSIIFDKGFTTTEGSGRGLNHVQTTLNDLGLGIRVLVNHMGKKSLTLEVYVNAN